MKQDEMNSAAAVLDTLQAKQNQGRGVSCVRDIVTFLRRGKFDEAQRIRQWDGDKTRSYPDIEKALTEIFGCRTHGVHNCRDWLCTETKLVWITNVAEDSDPYADLDEEQALEASYSWMYECLGKNTKTAEVEEEIRKAAAKGSAEFDEWYSRLVQGRPEPSDTYTVEALEEMGLYGLYMEVNQ